MMEMNGASHARSSRDEPRARSRDEAGWTGCLAAAKACSSCAASIGKVVAGDEQLRDDNPPAVLISGETGTGKELVARAFHFEGPRRTRRSSRSTARRFRRSYSNPSSSVTSAEPSPMRRRESSAWWSPPNGGTLFLDEIGDMEPALQVKLLRLLENRTVAASADCVTEGVNVRIIAATHRHLEALVAEGRFRADLYFRIRMIHLSIPALRDRGRRHLAARGSLPGVARAPLRQGGPHAVRRCPRALLQHRWPGNVRELRNVIEQAVLMSSGPVVESLDLDWLPASAGVSPAGSRRRRRADTRTGGTRRAAANARKLALEREPCRAAARHLARCAALPDRKYALAVPD